MNIRTRIMRSVRSVFLLKYETVSFFFGCSISEHEGRPKAAFVSIIGDDYLQYGIQRFKISKNFCQNH